MRYLALSAIAVSLLAARLAAEDAPQFRGPGGLGVSKETGLPLTWNEKENIRWKASLPGRGLSNPVVAAGRVYVTASSGVEQKRLHVLCFDVKTGASLWERQFWATGTTQCHPKTNMAAPTPIADGEHVYALFATGDLACLTKDGDLAWYRSLVGDYPTIGNNVGMASSPTFVNGVVLVNMQNVGESFAAGIDAKTGANRWRHELPRQINWVTPLVIRNKGQAEVVFQGGYGLLAFDPVTGAKKWALEDRSFATIPSPTFGDGMLFVPSGKFAAVRPGGDKAPEVLWESAKMPTGYCSPIHDGDKVYALSSGGVLNCADAKNGKPLWNVRVQGSFAASPLLIEGKLYLVAEDGVTTIVDPTSEDKIIATNPLPEKFLASPVASGGALFLRSDQHLYCIAQKK